VIDPGHGGDDTGGIGPTGLDEKDVVLDVATRLGRLLQGLGAEVTYTRATDIYLPLEARTGIANRERGDLFISIHGNSNPDHSARGVETYYLNFTSAPDALEVAARENTVAQKSVSQLRDLVQKIALQDKIQESRELATAVQNSIGKNFPDVRNRGVKEAPFIVLTGANMPAILTEISFLSNPGDEANLKDPEYRQKIALALYQGISDYISKLGGVQLPVRTAAAATGASITPMPPSPPPAMIPPTRSDVVLGFIAENRPFVVTAFLLLAAWSFFLLAPGVPGHGKMSYLQMSYLQASATGDKGTGQITEIPKRKRSYVQHRKLRLVRRS
jgi:N-acetylmuramoyl-L-alanine amidase